MECKSFKWQVRKKVKLSASMPRINVEVSLSITQVVKNNCMEQDCFVQWGGGYTFFLFSTSLDNEKYHLKGLLGM